LKTQVFIRLPFEFCLKKNRVFFRTNIGKYNLNTQHLEVIVLNLFRIIKMDYIQKGFINNE